MKISIIIKFDERLRHYLPLRNGTMTSYFYFLYNLVNLCPQHILT